MKNQISLGASVPGVQSPTNDKPTGCDATVRDGLTKEERRLVERHRESQRKRGAYWLTPEGREELREAFSVDDGSAVRPLLDALDAAEERLSHALWIAKGHDDMANMAALGETIRGGAFHGTSTYNLHKRIATIIRAAVREREASQPASDTPNATVPCGAEALAKSKASEPSADDSYDPDDGRV